ncbi:hypothetical protein D3C72_2114150 [compost metagenome]
MESFNEDFADIRQRTLARVAAYPADHARYSVDQLSITATGARRCRGCDGRGIRLGDPRKSGGVAQPVWPGPVDQRSVMELPE